MPSFLVPSDFPASELAELKKTYDDLFGKPAIVFNRTGWTKEPRLILRSGVPLKVTPIKETPKTYTAAEVFERYGRDVLEIFGYRYGGTKNNLMDYPGFAFSGKLGKVRKGDWYLTLEGARLHADRSFFGTYLHLIPTPEPLPRIVTFMLTEAADFHDAEMKYLPADDGSMTPVDAKNSPAPFYYSKQEAA